MVRKPLAALLSLSMFLGVSAVVTTTSAGAIAGSEISSTPDIIWDVATPDPGVRHTGQVRALVRDLVEYDGKMYAAGKFLEVVAPDGTTYDQPYLAAFDLETGVWIDSFRPQVDGMIYALEIMPDGRLYASGEMSGGIALYDASTGVRDTSFTPGIENSWGPPAVFDIEVVGNQIYAGGTFSSAQGTALVDLARVDATTGALDTGWLPVTDFDTGTPRLAGHNIFGLAVDDARGRVYLAGKFGGINGDDTASYFATLDTADGSLRTDVPQGLPAGITNHRESFSMWMMDVQFRDDKVYVGGQGHQTMILDADTLLPSHTFFSNRGVGDDYAGGDTQVIFLGTETIWSGCHCWGSVGEYVLGSYNAAPDGVQTFAEYSQWVSDFRFVDPFGQQKARGGFGIDIESETLVPLTFGVVGQAGAYAISEDSNGRVWFGGQYSRDTVNDRVVQGIVRFSPIGAEPIGPTGLRSTLQTRDRIVLNWQAVPEATSYEVSRDGVAISNRSSRWLTDLGVTAGTDYTYTVRAQFADGTFSLASEPLAVATAGDPVGASPEGLRSTLQTRERIVLNWERLDGAATYQVLRDGVVVTDQSSRWFTDRSVAAGTEYSYTVRAIFAGGTVGAESAPISVSTLP